MTIDPHVYRGAGWQLISLHRSDSNVGKQPLDRDWTEKSYADAEIDAAIAAGHNVGVRMSDTQVVIDYDPRNDPDGAGLAALRAALPDLDEAPCVVTGGNGAHFYFRLAEPVRLRDPRAEMPGVEFKGKGRQVVAVGSIHPETRRSYEWHPFSPPLTAAPELPADFAARFRRQDVAEQGELPAGDLEPRQLAALLAQIDPCDFAEHARWLELGMACFHATNGAGREVFVEWSTRDPRYADDAESIRSRWATWTPKAGQANVTAATLYRAVGEAGGSWRGVFSDMVDTVEAPRLSREEKERGEIERTATKNFSRSEESGKILPTENNVRIALAKLGVILRYNKFTSRREIAGLDRFGPELSDRAEDEIRIRFADDFQFRPPVELFSLVVRNEGCRREYHPIVEYVNSLRWDGVPRLATWLIDCAGCEDSPYVRAVGRLQLIASVRRVRQPGVKKDECVVLESPQGRNKSTALAILARNPEWFADNFNLNCTSKEALEQLQGKWIVELAEMRGMRKSEVEALKAFMSATHDRARPAYGRHSIDQPRQCTFWGSTNSAAYLRDATGNRRFWPVAIREFDVIKLRAIADQLWAEAAAVEAEGESLFLDPRLYEAARIEQEAREVIADPWADRIADALEDVVEGKIHSDELFRLVGHEGRILESDGQRLCDAAQRAGWVRARNALRVGGKPRRGVFFKGELSRAASLPTYVVLAGVAVLEDETKKNFGE